MYNKKYIVKMIKIEELFCILFVEIMLCMIDLNFVSMDIVFVN